MNKTIDKYLTEGSASGEVNNVVYQFTEVSDGIDDLLVNLENIMLFHGDDPTIKKALYKHGAALDKLMRIFGKQVVEPIKKKYK